MITGDPHVAAFQVDLIQVVARWKFGRFLMWVDERAIGDPEDESVDLSGCVNWLRDFAKREWDRYEPGLFEEPKERAFELLTWPDDPPSVDAMGEAFPQTYERFHIQRFGMSSFDRFTVLLVESRTKEQRVLWREIGSPVEEAFLPPRTLQDVARRTAERMAPILAAAVDTEAVDADATEAPGIDSS